MRCDRVGRQGGGVGLYLREDLTADILCSFDNGVCGLLVVMIHQLKTAVAVIYRPPDTRMDEFSELLEKLDSCLSALPAPTPSITVMGDLNFTKQVLTLSRGEGEDDSDSSDLVPIVSNHRDAVTAGGKQDRLQASRLCDLAIRHCLMQQVDQITHGTEILDLIFTNNSDLISTVAVESWPSFSDHKLVIACTSFDIGTEPDKKEVHLLECGKRLKQLNFNKAQWVEVQAELSEIDWSDLEQAAETSPTQALSVFLEEIVPVLERHVPIKQGKKKKIRTAMDRRRKLLWRRLSKVRAKLKSSKSTEKLSKFLQQKSLLEQQLLDDYTAVNRQEEDQAILNMKSNPKSFFSFCKSRQNTKSRIGPFLDQVTGRPNPDPDFAAAELSKQ